MVHQNVFTNRETLAGVQGKFILIHGKKLPGTGSQIPVWDIFVRFVCQYGIDTQTLSDTDKYIRVYIHLCVFLRCRHVILMVKVSRDAVT